ncbi:ribonuclease H-like domain-containing protein [Tanacetum coccineum]
MAGEDEFHDDNPPPPPVTPTQQAPHTLSTIKLPILKKGEYDIWAMKMEHYLGHTDYPIWEVMQKGNGPVQVSTDTNGQIRVLSPKTAEEILARERERKARTTLLMEIPEDHLTKFHKMTNAKEMWEAIKSRFGGNDESKKMQKYILKQQFESFFVSNSERLHKGYDRFQSLLSQLEIHGAGVSTEDANKKFLRSLPASWSQVSLIMRTKPGVDTLGFDDLYNNLRVFESNIKGSTASSSNTQNVAFVSSESTSSTNDVSTTYGVSTSSGHNSQKEGSSSYTDELKYSFFSNHSSGPQLDHEDLKHVDEFDLEEMDLKWQVAMISIRLKKFYKKTGRRLQFDAKELVGFDKTKEEPKALVTLNGDGVDWTSHAEDEQENFALMAYSNSCLDTEVTSWSKECVESYAKLKKLYDEQREQLSDASIEIKAYTLALANVEGQLVCHQKNQLAYEEKIRFMKIDLDDKTDVLTYHKKLLAEAIKEKEELKPKLENFQSSSKGLSKLLNSQMSTRDKYGLGYGNQIHKGVLSYEKEVLESVFDSRSSDIEDSHVYDRFAKVEGMHAVPPPMTGNYMPPKSDLGIDDVETLESVPEPVVVEPKVVSQPKVWSDAPIIEEYESDSDDEYVIKPSKEQEKPSFAFVNTVKHVKTHRETVKEQNTCSPSPKIDKRDWNGSMSKRLGLGYGFTKKACFVCGSFGHLIRDCDFYEKRLAKQFELNKHKGKATSQRENIWERSQMLLRARVLNDLSAKEKERYKADIRATNILLQGIPKDIYSLINHYTDAKDIWENVKMILEGSELTKDDRESQLYDEFEHFRKNAWLHETIWVVLYNLKYLRLPMGQPTDPQHTSTFAQLSIEEHTVFSSSKLQEETHKPRKAKRTTEISQSSGPIHLVTDETVYKEWEDRMERAATTASSLEAEQDSEAQTRFEVASKPFNDPPPLKSYTLEVGRTTPVEMRLHSQVLNVVPGGLPLLSLVDEIGLCTFPKSTYRAPDYLS